MRFTEKLLAHYGLPFTWQQSPCRARLSFSSVRIGKTTIIPSTSFPKFRTYR
jgi:hypothetical protein